MRYLKRRTFFTIVESKLKADPNKYYAIVMVDFDNFKGINDTLGHQFGDEVLIQTTNIINNLLVEDDIVARYGGEEIIIYINTVTSKEEIYGRIDNIRRAIENNRITVDNSTVSTTSSFGISFSTEEVKSLASNIQVADKLLYKAKYNGKNRIISS